MRRFTEVAGDVRYALRTWRRQPVFVAIAVLSLAAGIGLNTAVFSIINAIFLQSIRGVPQPERVAAIGTRVTYATFRHVRDNARTLDGVAVWQPVGVTLRYHDLVVRRVVPAMIFANWTLDPLTIAGVLAVFSAATLAACYVPGRRATRIDPIQVLRAQ